MLVISLGVLLEISYRSKVVVVRLIPCKPSFVVRRLTYSTLTIDIAIIRRAEFSAHQSMESAASTLLKELDNKEVIISGSVENEESEKDAAERKRKSSAASSDASTTPKTREKVKNKQGQLNPSKHRF